MKLTIEAIALFAVLACAIAGPQQSGAGSIDGTVVRLGTNEPISGVNVEMRRVEGTAASPLLPPVYPSGAFSPGAMVIPNAPNPADAFYATTGSDGVFRFLNLKPGKYRLLAAHPSGTFYPAEFGQRNPRGPGYDFSIADAPSMKIRIEMAPMGSVSGHVTGADGKPAAHVHVLAAEIAYQNGTRVLNQMQGVETDERGNYRLFWLPPGRYYIGAFPEGIRRRQTAVPFGPPAAVESMNQSFSQAPILYRTNTDGDVIPEVYEVVYSPGETNPDFASAIDLRLGSNVAGIDIALTAGRHRAVRIRGIVDDSAGKPAIKAQVQAVPRTSGPITFGPTTTTDNSGAYEISGLMQGNYWIVSSFVTNSIRQYAIQSLTVGSMDIDGVNLAATPGLTLSTHITADGVDTDGYRINLSGESRFLIQFSNGNSAGSQLSIPIQAGNYRVNVSPFRGGNEPSTYLKSIRFGGVEAADGMVRIGDTPPAPLEVALGRNGGIAEGRVLDGQRQPSPNVIVVVVPVDSRRPDLFKSATTDLTGHFRIQGIAPGNYLEFAWPWLPDGLWQYPAFLNSVLSRGTRVAVSEGSTQNMDITLLPEITF